VKGLLLAAAEQYWEVIRRNASINDSRGLGIGDAEMHIQEFDPMELETLGTLQTLAAIISTCPHRRYTGSRLPGKTTNGALRMIQGVMYHRFSRSFPALQPIDDFGDRLLSNIFLFSPRAITP
jgi:hypothetical protein